MSMIGTFNRAVSSAVNKSNEDYIEIFGDPGFVPEVEITESSDFNCGALCNELEYLREVSQYYVRSFDIDIASGRNLESLISAFIDLPRRNKGEQDAVYRNRFRTLANQSLNRNRTTRWALLDALKYFMSGSSASTQVIELFDISDTYFQFRIEGVTSFDDALFLGDPETGYLDQNFLGGEGIGDVISYIGELIDRIKAAGVDYDLVFIRQFKLHKESDAKIGSVQKYITTYAVVSTTRTFVKLSNAEVV